MYVGRASFHDFSNFIYGYCFSQTGPNSLMEFQAWIEMRFVIKGEDWSWSRIMLHEFETDQKCFDELPTLYNEFLRDESNMGIAGIRAEAKRRLQRKYGRNTGHPDGAG